MTPRGPAPVPATHFWEMTEPSPLFVCGLMPKQERDRHVFSVHTATPRALTAFVRVRNHCKNCNRVLAARLSGPGPGKARRGR